MPALENFKLTAYCLVAAFIKNEPVFVSADGKALLPNLKEDARRILIGDGIASATLSPEKSFILTGGEDGRLCRLTSSGQVEELANLGKKWLTSIACGQTGYFVAASGRSVYSFENGKKQEWQEERSVEGLAFAPKGLRLAVARYNGVSLHWLGTDTAPQKLEWKGAHNNVTFSPDGKFLVTSMQENALHGWRLSDSQHLRMSGYPAKVKNWSWSMKGRHLATSGAMAAVVWPFVARDGPMGKAPLELGTRANMLVTCVACHPKEEMVAIGYEDGMILFARFSDHKEVMLRPSDGYAITAMGWDGQGLRLAFGCAGTSSGGTCGLIDISS